MMLKKEIIQFIKFGIVGASNTLISYLINLATLAILKDSGFAWDYIVANIVAYLISVLWAFYWNNRYVFKNDDEKKGKTILNMIGKTYLAYGFTGIILTNILSYIWVDLVGISKLITPLINLIITVPLNFFIIKNWVFYKI